MKHAEHENHERWLVSYADFITLLFAFFTVLYATAQTDQQKIKAVVDGMNAVFDGGMPDALLDRVFKVLRKDICSSSDRCRRRRRRGLWRLSRRATV